MLLILCYIITCFFPSLKVISLPRVIRVGDVASILGSNKHNGFPVSIAFSHTGLTRDYLVLCADVLTF